MTDKEVKQEFLRLKEIHDRDTCFHSSVNIIYEHWAYQEIIKLGPQVIPYLLEDFKNEEGHWFMALREISGEDIHVPDDMRGRMRFLWGEWIKWGVEKGYIK